MKDLITYCGFDGTGKTFQAIKKQAELNAVFIHAHSYSISKDSFGLKPNFIFIIFVPFLILDNLWTYHFKYKPILKTKNLICDRYFYDKVARAMYYGFCPKWLARIWIRLIPRPTKTYFMLEPIADRVKDVKKWREQYLFILNEVS